MSKMKADLESTHFKLYDSVKIQKVTTFLKIDKNKPASTHNRLI